MIERAVSQVKQDNSVVSCNQDWMNNGTDAMECSCYKQMSCICFLCGIFFARDRFRGYLVGSMILTVKAEFHAKTLSEKFRADIITTYARGSWKKDT